MEYFSSRMMDGLIWNVSSFAGLLVCDKRVNKVYRYMDKLADIVNEYYNTYQSTIKMKPADVKASTFIDLLAENNKHIFCGHMW